MGLYRPDIVLPELGEGFFDEVAPAAFPERTLRFRNQRWAERVGLGELEPAAWERHFARFLPLPDNLPRPLALRYHGHQFGVYNPHLGDGRGFVFAELRGEGDRHFDLSTKGSGQTPWSRGGDGRLTLKGGVREVLATEMLEALGVPTSKTLSLFETGESLTRGDEPSPTRSSVLVRLIHSSIRFGTFQRHAHARDEARLAKLLALAAGTYMPELLPGPEGELPTRFLREVTLRTAETCASLMVAGFVHGVLNSDNMNVTGECFDYGPYRFLPRYDPGFTAAYFDHSGLYAYAHQPRAMVFNLTRLADALRPLCPTVALAPALREFEPAFLGAMQRRLCERLGLVPNGPDLDGVLVDLVFDFLHGSEVGFDDFFFDWYGGVASRARARGGPRASHYEGAGFRALEEAFGLFAPAYPERLLDPYFARVEPERMLIDEIEAIWAAIAERDDWSPFDAKVERVRAMGRAYGRGG